MLWSRKGFLFFFFLRELLQGSMGLFAINPFVDLKAIDKIRDHYLHGKLWHRGGGTSDFERSWYFTSEDCDLDPTELGSFLRSWPLGDGSKRTTPARQLWMQQLQLSWIWVKSEGKIWHCLLEGLKGKGVMSEHYKLCADPPEIALHDWLLSIEVGDGASPSKLDPCYGSSTWKQLRLIVLSHWK